MEETRESGLARPAAARAQQRDLLYATYLVLHTMLNAGAGAGS